MKRRQDIEPSLVEAGLPSSPANGVASSVQRLRETEQEADDVVRQARQEARAMLDKAQERVVEERRAALDKASQAAAEECRTIAASADEEIRSIDATATRRVHELKRSAGCKREEAVRMLLAEVLS